MSYNIGLNVIEVDGRATPSIQGAATSVVGMIIRSKRGIPGKVVPVTNWSEFVENFGSYKADANGAYAIRGFFDNGGMLAYITRVVSQAGVTATAAKLTSNLGPWNLEPGDTFDLSIDGSTVPITAIFTWEPAELKSKAEPFDVNNKTLSFNVNESQSDEYLFVIEDAADLTKASAQEIVAVVNRKFSGIQAWVDNGHIRIRTDRGDGDASLSASGSAASILGLTGTSRGKGKVQNIDAVTADEVASILTEAIGNTSNVIVTEKALSFSIVHKIAGSSHSLAATGPAANAFSLTSTPGTDVTQSANAAKAATGTLGGLTLSAGYRGTKDVGAWGNDYSVKISNAAGSNTLFDMEIKYTDKYQERTVETWSNLSLSSADARFIKSILNDELTGSKYVVVVDVDPNGNPVTSDTKPLKLENGSDGLLSKDEETNAYSTAIDSFDTKEIQLLCCPETGEAGFVTKALSHCAVKGDRMFVGHTPDQQEATDIDQYSSNFKGDKVYGTLYFPWIQVADPIGTRRWIPPTGHILGVYARTERERGIWKAPAGNSAAVRGALNIRQHINDITHTQLVKNAHVNAVRAVPGVGIVIDSSRTLSNNPLWFYVNVRLLFNFVKTSLSQSLRWVIQEPNDTALWNKVKYNSITPFLMGLWRRGAFGPGTPEQVFTVKIDAENNPPENIQQGIFTAEVYFYPSRPAETVILTIGQQEGAGSASEG